MRFLFVDAVTGVTADRITGRHHFSAAAPMRFRMLSSQGTSVAGGLDVGGQGDWQIAPGAVCEAIGQLASWCCLKQNDFSARQVFIFARSIDVLLPVRPGDTLDLAVQIHAVDAEAFRYSGEARVEGQVVQRIEDCSGFFMPLQELEDPEQARRRFAALCDGGVKFVDSDAPPYDFEGLLGEVLQLEPHKSIRTRRRFAASERFYADHFPRFPVTPIVMLNEMIGQATQKMLGVEGRGPLRIRRVTDVKIRSFVRPEEDCEALVRVEAISGEKGRLVIDTIAEIQKDGRRILRGKYQFELVE